LNEIDSLGRQAGMHDDDAKPGFAYTGHRM
jgi:hypothetical protein